MESGALKGIPPHDYHQRAMCRTSHPNSIDTAWNKDNNYDNNYRQENTNETPDKQASKDDSQY